MITTRPRLRPIVAFAAALAAVSVACKGTEPFVTQATTVTLSTPAVNLASIGASQQLTATVLDQRGGTIAGASVVWSTSNATVAGVSPAGLVTAAGNGTANVRATAGSVFGTALVTVAQQVAQLVKTAGDGQTGAVGAQLPLALGVRANDARGNPIPNVLIDLSVTLGGGDLSAVSGTTDASGQIPDVTWMLGATAGAPQAVRASVATGPATPVTFTATAATPGAPASVVANAGDNQTGLAGFDLNVNPAVLVRDAANLPVPSAQVDFALASGGGSVTGSTVMTNVNGIATVASWTVGVGPNALTATVTGVGIAGNPVSFAATGATAAYNIDVRYLTTVTPVQQEAFDSAKARWQRLIYGDVPDGLAIFPAGTCGPGTPAINETIDDIIIYAQLDSIDGPGKVVGRANACLIRDPGFLTGLGVMHFDTADVAGLIAFGLFDEVILHEMGHVLGFGTVWDPPPDGLGLIVGAGGADPHFVGAQAIAAFNSNGGAGYSAGAKVPLENCASPPPGVSCGAGARDGHWRETTFANELMTGFVNSGFNPLSVTSTASMGDLAYQVNYAASDPYTVVNPLGALRARPESTLQLVDDILRIPILVIDPRGRVVRVIQPR